MSTSTIRALNALVALAHIELGESALVLADHLDAQARADETVGRCEAQGTQLAMVYDRLAKPGASIYAAAMGVLARQSVAGKAVLVEAQTEQKRVQNLVDEQRQAVHGHQNRHNGLSRFLKEARAEHAAEVEQKAELEREDLFLVRRYLSEQAT